MHIEEVETGLREGRKRQRACLVCMIYTYKIKAAVFLVVEKLFGEWLRVVKTMKENSNIP